ncbi:aminotransferase class IV [Taibaiella chishuiensis]|uniref:branched-chain-amino-acid transaminase n=1 Tax=Taibaiella chishuiensis TaxID=1434707 RepID=A0A2P8DCW6_9BACT|nr:aminotransferase class IV [Taibaiella chishuiensis]PSK95056.1 branched-chain amino acid aminotransferase [Taibaiella chishuiensis]
MSFLIYNNELYPATETLFGTGNRAFRFGEGLIETMRWRGGQVRFFNDHMERLAGSLAILGWPGFPLNSQQLQQEIDRLVTSNAGAGDLMIRLQVFPAAAGDTLHFLLECLPLDPARVSWQEKGLQTGIGKRVVKSPDSIANLKTTSRLNYTIATQEAAQQGWDDILVKGPPGYIVESSISNLFWIASDGIYTPPLSSGCIAGIMRKKLLQTETLAGLRIQERETWPEDLAHAQEIFLSNAIRGIQPVAQLNGKDYPSVITRNIFTQFDTL